jgi:ribosomal protein L2
MALRKFNPITPGTRHKVLSKFEDITADKPHKPLLRSLKKSGGRNADGKMTMRYRGGGHKRRYRLIDFKRNKHMEATVLTVEYDPNRSARICLVEYKDGEKRYIIAPEGLKPGMTINSGMETRCTCLTFHSERSFTTLNCIQAREHLWLAAQVLTHNSMLVMVNMPLSSCLVARPA